MFATIKSLPIGLALILLGGCACKKCCPCRTHSAPTECRLVEPGVVTPDLSVFPENLPAEPVLWQFCELEESEAQCLAARNSKTANMLVKEAEAVRTQPNCPGNGSQLASELLILQATHKRNQDAAIALEMFMRLVEAEGGTQNLVLRLHEIEAMQTNVKNLHEHGVAAPITRAELENQQLELFHRQADVMGTVQRLNHQLQGSVGGELAPCFRYWPLVNLQVNPFVPDCDAAVAVALANRADLAALRRASQANGHEALAAAKILLGPMGAGSSTGSSNCLSKLLSVCTKAREARVRQEQLRMAYQEHQRTVEHEVRLALDLVHMRLTQVGYTRDRQQVARDRVKSGEKQQELTGQPLLGLRKLRLESVVVDQDLLHDVIEWKISVVRLKEAQGMLAVECGYNAASRYQCH